MDESSYHAASAVLGASVAEPMAEAGWVLVDALSVSVGMAGCDPAGVAWADSYDRSARSVLQATSDVITASFRLAALLEQTGFNYGSAESASVPGGTVPSGPDRTPWEWRECTLPAPESACGSGVPSPSGWALVADLVGYVWPNGHQDRLREAAAAWRALDRCGARRGVRRDSGVRVPRGAGRAGDPGRPPAPAGRWSRSYTPSRSSCRASGPPARRTRTISTTHTPPSATSSCRCWSGPPASRPAAHSSLSSPSAAARSPPRLPRRPASPQPPHASRPY